MGAGQVALILGAASDIAQASARVLAQKGWNLQLATRQAAALTNFKAELEEQHKIAVTLHPFDVLEREGQSAFIDVLTPLPDLVLMAVGYLGTQAQSEQDSLAAAQVMRSNYEGPALILGEIANRFAARGSGTIVGISSVAGERGRKTNYVYGASKAGFTAFLSGLRQRLASKGVHVVTVLPGFVDTKMVRHKNHPKILTARPETAARAIVKAIEKKRNVIYVLGIWRVIMTIIRAMPESLFKKTSL